MPYWKDTISRRVLAGEHTLVVAHGNSLRGLVKYLDGLSGEEIADLNIPTGIPLVYEVDDGLKPVKKYYLGDQEEIRKAAQKVSDQGKAAQA